MKIIKGNEVAIILILALIVSIVFNVFFLKNQKKDTVNNINTTVTRPIERIIEIRENVVFQKIPVVRPDVVVPTGECKEKILLNRIENATPNIKSDHIIITQFDDGSLQVNPTINGKMSLDYLRYEFQTSVKMDVKKVQENNIHALSILRLQDGQIKPDFGVGTTLDFFNKNITCGLFIDGVSAGLGEKITKNSSISIGCEYTWTGMTVPYAGISFKF